MSRFADWPGHAFVYRWRAWLLLLLSGLLIGLSVPGHALPPAWIISIAPLFLGLEMILAAPARSAARRAWKTIGGCWVAGGMAAFVLGDWAVNTAYVFGGLSLPVAHGVSVIGYGSLVGLEFTAAIGIPFWLSWRHPRIAFVFVPVWAAAMQSYMPRIYYWTFGQFMWPAPWLIQSADMIGSAGLNFIFLPLQMVLYGWVKDWLGAPLVPRRQLIGASAGVALVIVLAAGHGAWRLADLEAANQEGKPVRLAAIQPNFTLARLASNPALTHSDREQSFGALMHDTQQALAAFEGPGEGPTLVVWPESVFPVRFLEHQQAQQVVGDWVRTEQVHVVLASVLSELRNVGTDHEERKYYGTSVHVAPDGGPLEIYRKIFLIPFGETIPFGDVFPFYRNLLKAWIPRISEFEAGTEYTVFDLGRGIRLAPMICYDVTQLSIARGMVRNGANLGLVLANLAWFGRSTATDQFEYLTRFRALENRIPILLISQNGRSVLFDERAQKASRHTELFTADALSLEFRVPAQGSFFSRHGHVVYALYAIAAGLMALGLLLWQRRKALQSPEECEQEGVT